MILLKDAVFTYAREGRLTLQVPTYNIFLTAPAEEEKYEEYPDDYFVELRYDHSPAVGREMGFLFFSRKGWEALKDEFRKVYENGDPNRLPWEKWEEHAKTHFAGARKAAKRRKDTLYKKYKEAREAFERCR